VSQPGVLMPLARSVRQQLQQLGTALAEGGHASAGEYVLKILEVKHPTDTLTLSPSLSLTHTHTHTHSCAHIRTHVVHN
jgi:hypothetical protein